MIEIHTLLGSSRSPICVHESLTSVTGFTIRQRFSFEEHIRSESLVEKGIIQTIECYILPGQRKVWPLHLDYFAQMSKRKELRFREDQFS
jgi:hypothetical protein